MTSIALNQPGVRLNDRRYTLNGERVVVVPPPETLADVLRHSHRPVSRLEFLDTDDRTVLHTIDSQVLSGNVTTDRSSDTFTSASVSVVNDDGTLALDIAQWIWPGRLVRISRGAMVGRAPSLVPLITGIIAVPNDGLATGAVSFTVESRFAIAKRKFSGPTTIPAGIRGRDAIRQLLELGGLGTSDALYELDDNWFIVPVARTFDTNDEILGSAIKWAFDMGCNLWPDGNGVARMAPFQDPLEMPVTWDFTEGSAILTALTRTLSSPLRYNRQRVYGRGPDGYTIMAEAKVSNPSDPLYWTSALDLVAPDYRSDDLTRVADCQVVADRLLFENATIEETLVGEAVPVPFVSAGVVVTFSAADPCLLDTCSIPIGKGAMAMDPRRVRSLTVAESAPKPPPIIVPVNPVDFDASWFLDDGWHLDA